MNRGNDIWTAFFGGIVFLAIGMVAFVGCASLFE